MIKRITLAILGLCFAMTVFAATPFKEGVNYKVLPKVVANQPDVVEFFSFYCSHCYYFEMQSHVYPMFRKDLPKGVSIVKHHISTMGPLGRDLTNAWEVANQLGVQNKVLPELFNGIQVDRSIKTPNDIRNVFIKAGISGDMYDQTLQGFMVRAKVVQLDKEIKDYRLYAVPSIYVKGKYQVMLDSFTNDSPEVYAKELAQLVTYLVNKAD